MNMDDRPADSAQRRAAGELENEVLALLHAAGAPLSPGAVRERLSGGLAYTTVVTILSRLHAKGLLERARSGRAYLYAPVADEPGLAARRMATVLAAEPDREAVLARFVSGLSRSDEQLLRRMLNETGDGGHGTLDGMTPGDVTPGHGTGSGQDAAPGHGAEAGGRTGPGQDTDAGDAGRD